MNVVILAPISNKFMEYFHAVASDTSNQYLIFRLKRHVRSYPENVPHHVSFITLDQWDETVIEQTLIKFGRDNPIDVIFSYTEELVAYAAQLREKLGVAGQSVESARQFRDKVAMLDVLSDTEIKIPAYIKVKNQADLVEAATKIGLPIVIKPLDGMGSMDTHIVRTKAELATFNFDKACYLVENFIDWPLYHIDGFVKNREFMYVAPSRYFQNTLAYQQGQSDGSVQLERGSATEQLLIAFAKNVISKFKTPTNFIFHLEAFSDGCNVIFLEIAARLGGGRILQELEQTIKLNPIEELLKVEVKVVSEQLQMAQATYEKAPLVGFMLISPGYGEIKRLPNDIPFPNVYEYYPFAKIGKKYAGAHSSVEALAAVSITGCDMATIEAELKQINEWYWQNTEYQGEV